MNFEEYKKADNFLREFSLKVAHSFADELDQRLVLLAKNVCLAGDTFCENGWNENSYPLFLEWKFQVMELHEYLNK